MNLKNKIITSAQQLFLSGGYNKTSTGDIIGQLEIAKGTFYHHFRSKEKLLAATIDYAFEPVQEKINILESGTEQIDLDNFIKQISQKESGLYYILKIDWECANELVSVRNKIDDHLFEIRKSITTFYNKHLISDINMDSELFLKIVFGIILNNLHNSSKNIKTSSLSLSDVLEYTSPKPPEELLQKPTSEVRPITRVEEVVEQDDSEEGVEDTVFIPDE